MHSVLKLFSYFPIFLKDFNLNDSPRNNLRAKAKEFAIFMSETDMLVPSRRSYYLMVPTYLFQRILRLKRATDSVSDKWEGNTRTVPF